MAGNSSFIILMKRIFYENSAYFMFIINVSLLEVFVLSKFN